MNYNDLAKRLILLKRNPALAQTLSQSELVSLLHDVFGAFNQLKDAIETNKIKGDTGAPGKNGTTPRSGIDYLSIEQTKALYDEFVEEFLALEAKIASRLAEVKDGTDGENGKDAEITPELLEEVASLAVTLIELPDFQSMVSLEVDAFWAALDEQKKTIETWKKEADERIARAGKGGGTSRNTITQMINDTLQVVYVTGGVETRAKLYSSDTQPTSPSIGDLWAG